MALKSSGFLPFIIILVSSAYKIVVIFGNMLGKSFMYNKKRRGPSIEP
jgi:hypothetical protein